MKTQYITPGCEMIRIDGQDVIRTSVLSVEESNGGIILNWDMGVLS